MANSTLPGAPWAEQRLRDEIRKANAMRTNRQSEIADAICIAVMHELQYGPASEETIRNAMEDAKADLPTLIAMRNERDEVKA